jgi:hypothetical protein
LRKGWKNERPKAKKDKSKNRGRKGKEKMEPTLGCQIATIPRKKKKKKKSEIERDQMNTGRAGRKRGPLLLTLWFT